MTMSFGGWWDEKTCRTVGGDGGIHELNEPLYRHTKGKNRDMGVHQVVAPFPFFFDPTFHRYRLDHPQKKSKPQTIFVCSMADLFGNWVPDEWIEAVFEACEMAPQHRYLFLTKNPTRYMKFGEYGDLPERDNFWYGSTVTGPEAPFMWSKYHNTFLSIEPLMAPLGRTGTDAIKKVDWIIIGAMSGPRAKAHPTRPEWVRDILSDADEAGVPVFMKDSLIPIVGEENMRREFPWVKGGD